MLYKQALLKLEVLMMKRTFTIKITENFLISISLIIYLATIIFSKFFRYSVYIDTLSYNWNPFLTDFSNHVLYILFLNVIILIPFGIFCSYKNNNKILTMFSGLLICFIFELLQPIFKAGIFDITTILANFIGILVGFYLFQLFLLLYHKNTAKVG